MDSFYQLYIMELEWWRILHRNVWTDESLSDYKHIVVYVLETAMKKTKHGVRLLDFVRQVFGNLEVILESNTHIFSEVTWLRSIRLSHDPIW